MAYSAGPDQADVEPFTDRGQRTLVVLSGTSDSGATTWAWTQVSGPTVALIGSGPDRSFVAPALPDGATLVFDLGGDRVTITVATQNEWITDNTGALRPTSRVVFPTADTFIDYTTEPTRANSGVQARPQDRTAYAGPYTITTGGTTVAPRVISDVNFTKVVVVQAPNIIFERCRFTGDASVTGNTGLLLATHDSATNIRTEFCDFEQTEPTYNTNAILGDDVTAYRCWMSHVVDGVGTYDVNGTSVDVAILCSWIGNLSWYNVDRDHTDGTHNDLVQLQSGTGLRIWGCTLYGYKWNALGTPALDSSANNRYPQVGNGILIQANAGAGGVTPRDIDIQFNFIYGCDHVLTIRTGATVTFKNNRLMDTGQRNYGGSQLYYLIRMSADCTLNGEQFAATTGSYTQPSANNKRANGADMSIRVDAA